MKLFHRKSPWQRAVEKVPGGSALRGGALTAAGLIGLSAVSAAVSAIRDKQRPS
ncbi:MULTISPECIES: hypothetical protein [Mumia]|uniref:hypothetical protein n=1 Tax=Mumia TaxID=1546255 RepID=UPI0015FAA4B8|nr:MULTISPECIES: hypothetical protein [unclassified Mumia]QMW66973.1 hypothetical protein H4N58_03255 [Mumia sp. ZJ1417]